MRAARAARRAGRVLGAVDEPEQVALVEVDEAVHLVGDRRRAVQPRHDLLGELEAQVHPGRADVEQQVAGRADGVPPAGPQFAERMQPGRAAAGRSAGPRPLRRTRSRTSGDRQITESDRPDQSRTRPRTGHGRVAAGGVWLTTATRKIAAPVSGETTACGSAAARARRAPAGSGRPAHDGSGVCAHAPIFPHRSGGALRARPEWLPPGAVGCCRTGDAAGEESDDQHNAGQRREPGGLRDIRGLWRL